MYQSTTPFANIKHSGVALWTTKETHRAAWLLLVGDDYHTIPCKSGRPQN